MVKGYAVVFGRAQILLLSMDYMVYIVGNAVRNEARGQICEATSSPEFVISVFI